MPLSMWGPNSFFYFYYLLFLSTFADIESRIIESGQWASKGWESIKNYFLGAIFLSKICVHLWAVYFCLPSIYGQSTHKVGKTDR